MKPHSVETPQKILVIGNGKIAQAKPLRELIARFRAAGHQILVRVTWEHGDAERFVREAVELGCTKVVAAGGDGTINGVLSGLMHIEQSVRPSMGIIPLGTANDFAKYCGLPTDAPEECMELILNGVPVARDVGCANNMYFINMASGGFSSELTAETSDELKGIIGKAAYFFTGITQFRNLEAIELEIAAPDFNFSGKVLCFSVGLGILAGGGIQVFSKAPKPGKFNILIIPSLEQANTLRLLHELFSKSGPELSQEVYRLEVDSFSVQSKNKIQVNLDGEPVASNQFDFKVIPDAINLHLPQAEAQFQTNSVMTG